VPKVPCRGHAARAPGSHAVDRDPRQRRRGQHHPWRV